MVLCAEELHLSHLHLVSSLSPILSLTIYSDPLISGFCISAIGSRFQEGKGSNSLGPARSNSSHERSQSSTGEGSRTTLAICLRKQDAMSSLDLSERIRDMVTRLRADCDHLRHEAAELRAIQAMI